MDGILVGGNMNSVNRIGDTVHRNAGPWTPTVHSFLNYLARGGISWAPHPVGIDGDREILTFVEGDVPLYPLPDWVWADSVLVDGAMRLRQLHDASIGFPLDSSIWQSPAKIPMEVICHNDYSPHNLAFDRGTIVGAIDFDMCSPGPRIWDLAYFATRAVPLSAETPLGAPPASDARRRVQLIIDSYGSQFEWADVIRVAIRRLYDLSEFSIDKAQELAKPHLLTEAAEYERDAKYLELVLSRTID